MSSQQELRSSWLKRRWFDFRNGHSTYLIFVIQFAQFVVITYQLYVVNSSVNNFIPSIYHWVAFFIATYLPAAIIAGHVHRKRQMATDQAQQIDVNPLSYKTVIQNGKEALYTLRLNRLSYLLQEKSMRINNQIAFALNTKFNASIEYWEDKDIEQIREFRRITEALERGEDVRDVNFKETIK